ncbi:MAG: tetratricopeptide repeat protein [Planctomycetota bacterium]
MRTLSRMNLVVILCLGAATAFAADVGRLGEYRLKPCLLVQSDVGETERERERHAKDIAEHIADTSRFFMSVFSLDANDFVEYATKRDSEDNPFDPIIYIRFWRRYEEFLKFFQERYQTETIPGAYFGILRPKDQYGNPTGPWRREIGCHTEGLSEEAVLRHLYHEMGHLFMKTFMIHSFEVPSWIEEGTAELFQLRDDNGTNPEIARREREGWLVEMVRTSAGEAGAAIPWADFTQVRNMDNLNFTHQDPLRSSVQYAQAWSVAEFMIANRARQRAYSKFLHGLRDHGRKLLEQEFRSGKNGRKLIDTVTNRLYKEQYAVFERFYGTSPLKVEQIWRDWVVESFEDKADRDPELHYYRGDWHLSYRARYARSDAEKQQIQAKAEAAFRMALEEAPDEPEGHVGMGRLALARGDVAAANGHFADAVERGANSFEANLYGGIALRQSGRFDEAVKALERAYEVRSSHYEVNLHLGWALGARGAEKDAAAALMHLKQAQDLKPSQRALPGLIAGTIALRERDLFRARVELLRAQSGMPQEALVTLLLALHRYHEGDRSAASALLASLPEQWQPAKERMEQQMEAGKVLEAGFAPDDGNPGIADITYRATVEPSE